MARAAMRTKGGDAGTFEALPADTYVAKIRDADITESKFKDEKTGEPQWQLQITWEVTRLTAEQLDEGLEPGKWIKQWYSLYYGDTKKGPSKLKAFVESLQSQGLLSEFDPEDGEIDSDWFLEIEQRIVLEVKGEYNNVVSVLPLRKPKGPAAAVPLKTKPAAPAPRPKNQPVHVDQANEDEDLFKDEIPF